MAQHHRDTGLTRFRLFCKGLRLALAYCLPPHWVYHYQLYLPERDPWVYVYDTELAAFHRWRDGQRSPAGMFTLADKWQCNRQLAAIGVPVAQTSLLLARGEAEPDWQQFTHPLFLKPRSSSAGRHCFYLNRASDGRLCWRAYGKQALPGLSAYQSWQRARREHDYLIQPCYANAPALAGLADEAITLRVLTKRLDSAIVIDLAFIEIPFEQDKHDIYAMDLATGEIFPIAQMSGQNSAVQRGWNQSKRGNLPFWQQAASSAIQAHQALAPDLFSVAWDFVLTPDGALLLEGNSTWGVAVLQAARGGLLADSHE